MFLLFRALFVSVFVITTAQEFKYQVVAPEFICSQDNMSQTAIRLTGEDVQNLKFNWSVSFKINDTQNLQQRLVLMIWRSVRSLNQVLQNVSKEDINQGVIHINNSMLTPDVQYLINITAHKVDNNKTLTNQKQIAMEYVSRFSKKSTMAAMVKGPEMTYADMPYTAQAEIKSCSEHNNYQLSWHLLDRTKRMLKEEKINSRILQIPPGTFSSGEEYMIVCSVLDQNSKMDRSNVSLRVNVLKRGMKLSTYIKNIKIGPNQPIYLNAYFSDPDCNKGELVLQWKCTNEVEKECPEFGTKNTTELVITEGFSKPGRLCLLVEKECPEFGTKNSTELFITEGFSKPGRYTFTILASKNNATISASSIVEVVEELVPIIDIENAITTLNPSDPLKITAHVSRLVEGCTLQWNSLKLDNNPNLDADKMGESGKVVMITEEEMSSLEEEDKNYNETFADKQHDLFISKTNDLQSGFQYLFRLIASCPCLEITTVSSVTKKPDRYVIATADVTIQINPVPILKALKVSPKNGDALRTIFSFTTQAPQNFSTPLLYKYGILTKSNKKMFLAEQYDTITIETILPFGDEPIQTVLEVCDSKNACNWTMGSKVIVKMPNNLTLVETDALLNNFNKSMVEQDYFHAFTLSSMLMQSAQNITPNSIAQKFDESIKNITRREIKKFLQSNDSGSIYPASNLLKYIKILDSQIQLPQDIFSDVLALRDKISERSNSLTKKQSQLEKISMEPAPGSRKLLSLSPLKKAKRIVNDINIDEIKEYLEISELAIKRLTDFERVETEKQKLRERLQYYLPRICQSLYNNYKTSLRIEMQTIVFEVEKINLNRKYNDYILIPFDIANNARIQLGKELAEKHRNNNGLCIGKILFLEDYFHIPQFVYDVNLYSVHSDNMLDTEETDFGINIEMPIKSIASNNQRMQCVLWEDDQWDMTKCKTMEESQGKVKCLCQALGYYSMMPVERTTTTTTTASTITTNTIRTTEKVPSSQLIITESDTIVALPTDTSQRITNNEQNFPQTSATQTEKPVLLTTSDSIEQKTSENYKTATANTEVQSAAVWSISVMSIGIGVLIIAFCILLKKTQRSKAVQSFQTIEYARYFDENNLE